MDPAQVLDFSECRQRDDVAGKGKRFREAMHKELDKFLDQIMGALNGDARPTLSEFSDLLTRTRVGFLGACFQHMMEEKYSDDLNAEKFVARGVKSGKKWRQRRGTASLIGLGFTARRARKALCPLTQ